MNRDIAINNLILKTKTGSFLYGTSTETSDKDYVGVFIPPVEYYILSRSNGEVDFSISDKEENGKNSSRAIDFKAYEISKFIKLLSGGNPNVLELIFSNEYEAISNVGREIVDNRSLFVHKGLYKKFVGYSHSQRHKMLIKSNRPDLVARYGYDTKFASHLIRLFLECIELLDTGELSFPLKYRDYIVDIKNGKYSREEIIEASESLERECEARFEKTKLPDSADYEKIDELLIRAVKAHWDTMKNKTMEGL